MPRRLSCLAPAVFASIAVVPIPSHATPPRAFATQSADGQLSLVLRPEADWASAELTIVGGDTFDLGPAQVGQAVEVEGWAQVKSSHPVMLRIADPNGTGLTVRFDVDTQVLPDRPPLFQRGAPRTWKWRPFSRPPSQPPDSE